MKIIEIDDEVYAYLQSKAIPFEDKTPSDTIRRLLGLYKAAVPPPVKSLPGRGPLKVEGRKTPPAKLPDLITAGYLEENQVLHLRDYRGRKILDSEARIYQGGLLKDGENYSMSNLARKLFKEEGYHSKTVSGPVYWFTDNNVSIKNLWDDYLEKIAQQSEA